MNNSTRNQCKRYLTLEPIQRGPWAFQKIASLYANTRDQNKLTINSMMARRYFLEERMQDEEDVSLSEDEDGEDDPNSDNLF
jgi:predicted RNA-binding protein